MPQLTAADARVILKTTIHGQPWAIVEADSEGRRVIWHLYPQAWAAGDPELLVTGASVRVLGRSFRVSDIGPLVQVLGWAPASGA